MTEHFDDELARMDELEEQADSAIFEALSLDDPIRGLTLRHHPTVQSGSTLQSVIDILRNEKVGCVMVEKDNQIIGVMTERDFLLRAIAKGLDMTAVTIDDYMTKNPETLHPDDPISYALNKMHVFGIRHIPIIEESGASSDGFKTMVHPAASAGITFKQTWFIGQFHGVINAQTPFGS